MADNSDFSPNHFAFSCVLSPLPVHHGDFWQRKLITWEPRRKEENREIRVAGGKDKMMSTEAKKKEDEKMSIISRQRDEERQSEV